MREEFHPRFIVILQIIYQREQLAYFNNHIAVTLIWLIELNQLISV
jgi:hypothetical protein